MAYFILYAIFIYANIQINIINDMVINNFTTFECKVYAFKYLKLSYKNHKVIAFYNEIFRNKY